MIEFDNGPVAIALVITIAFLAPILYGLFIDKNKKDWLQGQGLHGQVQYRNKMKCLAENWRGIFI